MIINRHDLSFLPALKEYYTLTRYDFLVISENYSKNPKHCKRCGGDGMFVVFVPTCGPFESTIADKELINKAIGDRFYGGKNYVLECPVCKGTGLDKDYKPGPVRDRRLQVESALSKVDYTDY